MYMYSTGRSTKTMIQIVKGELRKIGDWSTYSTRYSVDLDDDEKDFVGWYWYNTNKETRYWMEDETLLALEGKKAELFDQLNKIYEADQPFFKVIADKLMVSLWMFQDERARRENIRLNTPRDVKYVIYDTTTNDNGWTVNAGEPIGSVIVRTTGDPNADKVTAIKRHLASVSGESEDKVMGVGFYNALIFEEYADQRETHLDDLRNKLADAEKAAIYE